MAANKVTYNVGTSNKFAGFYDEHDVNYHAHQRSNRQFVNPTGSYQTVPRYGPVDQPPTYTDDNIFDTRARGRHVSRRFRGNPNAPRKFDRVSGTGRGKEIKKQGEGGHNWGNPHKDSKELASFNQNENEIVDDLNNLSLNEKDPSRSGEDKESLKHNGKDKAKNNDVMDFDSYKLLQQSKRTNLPTFTVNDNNNVSTDMELQNDGYVRYVKKTEQTKLQEKVKVVNYNTGNNPQNVLPSHPSSFRDRRSRQKFTTFKPKNTNNRIRVKAPDLTDLKTFPCLDLKS